MLFVTGGTGLIGSHLLYELVSAGKKVRALKRDKSDLQQVLKIFSFYREDSEELFSRIEWVEGDILDFFRMEELLRGISGVFHCAGMVSFNARERRRMIRNNVEGTANMVNAALENEVEKFCHVSSVAALGKDHKGSPVTEDTSWLPGKSQSGYAVSKFFSEAEIWRGMEEGLDVVIVNPSIVIGPGDWESGSPQLFNAVWKGMRFYTRGITGFVDVRDVVRAMVLLMEDPCFGEAKNQRFLLSAENLSYQDVFNQIADALEKPRPSFHASDFMLSLAWRAAVLWGLISGQRPAITREAVAGSNAVRKFSGNKICRLLNMEYIPVSQSVKQTAAYFKQEAGSL